MPAEGNMNKTIDGIQERLTSYACALDYDGLTPEVIHAAKVRVIDTLGALFAGFSAEPCRVARNVAAEWPHPHGATVIGSRMRSTPDIAAFVNAATARCVEMNDVYQWPGSYFGHPSDVVTPVLAVAEYAHASGRELITGIVLAYEVYLRICDVFGDFASGAFENTNFSCLGIAMASCKLLRLSREQLAHGISMGVVPNNALKVSRTGQLTMWKVAAAGQAGRAGVFAALLAKAGMEGPHLPFEGKSGWCDHVALKRFSLDTMGGNGTPFKILDSSIKLRPCIGLGITSILAAEKVGPLENIMDVKQVIIEVYQQAKQFGGTGEHRWNPESKESADHSIPYVVAAALMDGTVTLRSYDEARLWNPGLRALMQKIHVVENEEFTRLHQRLPVEHRARITVVTNGGERLVGESWKGDEDASPTPRKSDAQIVAKFTGFTEDYLGKQRSKAILNRLWHLEDLTDVAAIPPDFAMD